MTYEMRGWRVFDGETGDSVLVRARTREEALMSVLIRVGIDSEVGERLCCDPWEIPKDGLREASAIRKGA